MPLFLFKSILGLVFFSAALGATFTMLTLMGRQNHKMSSKLLKILHKVFGCAFFALLLVLSFVCIKYVAAAGDQISLRAVSHSIFSLFLIIIFIVKILIVRFYKPFLKFIPVMGIIVFSLAFVVTATSAGFYFLRAAHPASIETEVTNLSDELLEEAIEKGRRLFENKCRFCHHPDKEENKIGPGLKGLLKKERLPHSGRPATAENVQSQLLRPVLTMPSFKDLSNQEMADLLAFLSIL